MLETSARLLRLLSLVQARRDWTSAELAARLDVTTRTIRNDIGRLRALGYPVDARPGVAGGYRLGPGRLAHLPGRPDRAAAAARPALHPAGPAARPGDRRGRGPRSRRGDLAVPGPRDRARARRPRQEPAADPGGSGVSRR